MLVTALLLPSRSLAHGSHDARIGAQSRLIEAAPADAQLYLDRAAVHLDRADWVAAMADIDRAAELDPDLATVHYLHGLLLWKRGWSDEAEGALNRFLAAEPENSAGFAVRARARADLRRPLDAAQDFSRAIAYQPVAGPDLYLERAQILSEAGDAYLAEALHGLEDGIAEIGPLPTLALAAVEIEVRIGRFNDAAQRLDAATRNFRVRAPWLVRRGEILEAAGRPEAAREAYQSALDEIAALPAHRRRLLAFAELRLRALESIARIEGRGTVMPGESFPQRRL
jgi:tetratricopeptide (TPR) repeat protein